MTSLAPVSGRALESTELVFISDSINAVGFSNVSWSWNLTEDSGTPSNSEGRNIVVTPQGMSLNIAYISEEEMFPIMTIDYLFSRDKDTRQSVDEWANVPDSSSDIVLLREDLKSWCDWSLSVTASGTDTSGNPAVATGQYDIRIFATYDTSRDILIEEVNKRRR